MWAVRSTIPMKTEFITRTSILKSVLKSEARIELRILMAKQIDKMPNRRATVGHGVPDDKLRGQRLANVHEIIGGRGYPYSTDFLTAAEPKG